MSSSSFAAVDLGAESGRVMLGSLTNQKIQIEEIHRFPTGGTRIGENLHWDVLRLWDEIKIGLSKAAEKTGGEISSIGLDTWGVDFGLLDTKDQLIGNPYHYRDERTNRMMDAVFERVPRDEVYARTGIQFMQLNSLYQLFSMVKSGDPKLSIAHTFLNMPDLFNFYLTGVKANEFTISTTTQCYDPVNRNWGFDLLQALDIPTHIFGEIINPGTILGKLKPALVEELGLPKTNVIASAGHDTACAVASVPASSPDYIYLSSGTWSLIGVELDDPLIDEDSLIANMTNEGGVGGKIRFLKNIVGLWLVQECRREWLQQGFNIGYGELTEMAADSPAFGSLVNPNDERFLAPSDMVSAIQSFCDETGQTVPTDKGEIVRCVLESLALEYREVADQIDHLTGKQHVAIHIIGGGSQNQLLNQFTAQATGKTVYAGPVEATAIGNILVHAIAMGEIGSLVEGRAIVRNSFPINTYQPQGSSAWDEAYQRFKKLKEYRKNQ
jgi:rhamnulokinase